MRLRRKKIKGGFRMAIRRISHAKGKGSINHNNRVHIYKNVDPTRTKDNICYAKENLETAYQKCFGEALANYNTKQKRADRKIENYYTHLFGNAHKDVVATSSNKEKSFYEIVVGIGDKNTCAVGTPEGELAAKILDEYAKGFSERNPNFYVFNSVMHLDEKTPHLHIDYVPVARGYKSGLETRNSQSVALQQMGFGKNKNSINEWRIRERKILRELCEKYGLEISEETQGRGKTYTPDEYKQMRDETKEELRNAPEFLDEIRDDYIAESKAELVAEAQKQADTEIGEIKNALAETVRPIEGKIALEKRINAMIDGIKESTLFGKTTTTIKFDGTAEQAMSVLNAAKDRDNAKKAKDKAVSEKNSAVKERDEAITAKNLAESNAAKKVAAAEEQIKTAAALKSNAAEEMNRANTLYTQQLSLNNRFKEVVAERESYKVKADQAVGLAAQVAGLKEGLRNAYISVGAMAKASGVLLYDPAVKLNNPTPEQLRLLQATRNYAAAHSKNAGFADIAQDIEKHYGLTQGIQNHIDELTPKPPTRKKSYGHEH
jgi:hypothetical protein